MQKHFHYETVTEAIDQLRKQGFTIDFNLEENHIAYHPEKFGPDEFDIVEVYRYEGDTDPADEATVYGIESKSGLKGILVTGFGTSSDTISDTLLKKLGAG